MVDHSVGWKEWYLANSMDAQSADWKVAMLVDPLVEKSVDSSEKSTVATKENQ